ARPRGSAFSSQISSISILFSYLSGWVELTFWSQFFPLPPPNISHCEMFVNRFTCNRPVFLVFSLNTRRNGGVSPGRRIKKEPASRQTLLGLLIFRPVPPHHAQAQRIGSGMD